MKSKLIYLAVLVIALVISNPLQAQSGDTDKASGMGKRAVAEVMAKPAFEATNGGLHLKVWVMSVIKGLKDNEMAASEEYSDDENPGTHHVMVEVADAESGREVPGAMVKLLSVSPSGKKSTIVLETMLDQYGCNISLDEKGEYQLSVSVNSDGKSTLTPFKYKVN
jgi:hypothetical protein